MNKQLFLAFLTCLFILESSSKGLPYTSNKALFLNERCNVDISGSNAVLKNNVWNTNAANYTINYPKYFVANSVMPNLYLGDFDFRNIENGVSCIIQPVNLTATGFVFNVKTSNSSNFVKLSINYFLIYSLKNFAGKFYVIGNLLIVNMNISKDVKTSFNTYADLPASLSTEDIIIRSFFSGFEIKSTSKSRILDLAISSRKNNSTSYQILVSSLGTEPTNVKSIRALVILFSKKFMQNNQEEFGYRFFSGTAKSGAKKTELSFQEQHQPMFTNMIVGISAFSLQKQTKFGFSTTVDQSIITVTSISPISSFSISYIVVQSTYCGYDTPYLQSVQRACYKECPGTTVNNDQYFSCDCYVDGFYEQDSTKCINPARLLQIQPVKESAPSNPIQRMIQKYRS